MYGGGKMNDVDWCKIDTKLHSEFRRIVVCRRLGISSAMLSMYHRYVDNNEDIISCTVLIRLFANRFLPVLYHVKRPFLSFISSLCLLFFLSLSRFLGWNIYYTLSKGLCTIYMAFALWYGEQINCNKEDSY